VDAAWLKLNANGRMVSSEMKGKFVASPLEKEFEYYLDHQGELVKKYGGKFIVIKDCKVIGAYESELEALSETCKEHTLGTFLVQKCEPGSENYTQSFHSRVSFA
jgi:hypothetical protein